MDNASKTYADQIKADRADVLKIALLLESRYPEQTCREIVGRAERFLGVALGSYAFDETVQALVDRREEVR